MIRHIIFVFALTAGVSFGVSASTQDSPSTPAESTWTWRDDATFQARLQSLASAHSRAASITTIGKSIEGRRLQALRLARPGDVDPDKRPAILLVAGIDASLPHTSWCAIEVAQALLESADGGDEVASDFLEANTLYVIPRLNPDGLERNIMAAVRDSNARNMRVDDADRDRRSDEDGSDDLNGDGMITMMRVYDPRKADMIANPDDARLERKPEREDGERATFYLLSEGYDNDGDARHNEDGIGGVDLDKNFMHGYVPHTDGSGRHQLSEPEALALLQYALGHQNIAAVVVYGRHDTLSTPPSASGRNKAGAPNTIEAGDEAMYKRVSERFVELTDLKGVEPGDWSGSFAAWAYAQYGVPSFSTPLWTMPRSVADEEQPEADENQVDAPRGDSPSDEAPSRDGQAGRPARNWEAMRDEFDTNQDGELDDDERNEMRAAMRDRFGGRGGAGAGGGPPGGRGGRGGGGGRGGSGGRGGPGSGGGGALTPSGIGDISQETIDELLEWAHDQGFPVDDYEERKSEMTPEMVEMLAKQAGVEVRRISKTSGGGESRKEKDAPSNKDWLKYSDDSREGSGFVEWTEVEHPDFDRVEVGGWAPGFRTTPPTKDMETIVKAQTEFLLDLAAHLPDVQLQDVEVERLSEGLWSVRASLVNDGRLPAGTEMAKRNRRARPWVVRLGTDPENIINGKRVLKVWSLAPDGGRQDMRWVIEHPDGEQLEIELYSEKYGATTHVIPMLFQEEDGAEQ